MRARWGTIAAEILACLALPMCAQKIIWMLVRRKVNLEAEELQFSFKDLFTNGIFWGIIYLTPLTDLLQNLWIR